MVELVVARHFALYVVSRFGLTTVSQTPFAPVVSVAIRTGDTSPYCCAHTVTVSPASWLEIWPLTCVACPNTRMGAAAPIETAGAGPVTTTLAVKLGWS